MTDQKTSSSWTDGINRQVLEENFAGDVKDYLDYAEHFYSNTIDWTTLVLYDTYLVEYQKDAQSLINIRLGYLPKESLYYGHEIFIRELLKRYLSGEIQYQWEFEQSVDKHVRDIRNADMDKNISVVAQEIDDGDLDWYNTDLAEYKEIARKKISCVLGYTPDLKYSLHAEMNLRIWWSETSQDYCEKLTEFDLKAATLVRYRQIFLTQGEDAANESPTSGLPWDGDFIVPANVEFLI